MPTYHEYYTCDKCRKQFRYYGSARQCETNHVADEQAAAFSKRLKKILQPKSPNDQQ